MKVKVDISIWKLTEGRWTLFTGPNVKCKTAIWVTLKDTHCRLLQWKAFTPVGQREKTEKMSGGKRPSHVQMCSLGAGDRPH
eukprot:5153526-Pyramimonas_sp.AAC.1